MSDPNESKDEQQRIEDELDAALAALGSEPLPTGTLPEPASSMTQPEVAPQEAAAQVPTASPTLDALDESRRPQVSTVCEHCPNSVWFASPAEVKCYCRVMFLVTWSDKEPNQLTHCDGRFLGQA